MTVRFYLYDSVESHKPFFLFLTFRLAHTPWAGRWMKATGCTSLRGMLTSWRSWTSLDITTHFTQPSVNLSSTPMGSWIRGLIHTLFRKRITIIQTFWGRWQSALHRENLWRTCCFSSAASVTWPRRMESPSSSGSRDCVPRDIESVMFTLSTKWK